MAMATKTTKLRHQTLGNPFIIPNVPTQHLDLFIRRRRLIVWQNNASAGTKADSGCTARFAPRLNSDFVAVL